MPGVLLLVAVKSCCTNGCLRPPQILRERLEQAETDRSDLENELQVTRENFEASQFDVQETEELRSKLSSLEAQNEELRNQLSYQQEEVEYLTKTLEVRDKDVDELIKANEALQEAVREAKEAAMEEASTNFTSELERARNNEEVALVAASRAADSKVEALENQIAIMQEEIDAQTRLTESLQDENEEWQKRHKVLQDEIARLENELVRSEEELDQSPFTAAMDSAEIRKLKTEISRISEELRRVKAALAEKERECADHKTTIRVLEADASSPSASTAVNEELQQSNRELHRELAAKREQLASAERRMSQLTEEVQHLRDSANRRSSTSPSEIKRLKQRIQDLERQLATRANNDPIRREETNAARSAPPRELTALEKEKAYRDLQARVEALTSDLEEARKRAFAAETDALYRAQLVLDAKKAVREANNQVVDEVRKRRAKLAVANQERTRVYVTLYDVVPPIFSSLNPCGFPVGALSLDQD